jgi:alanine-glyoxylate transaminase/serine-glyoxylate transaminase/serine-pyruvate transaminase
MAPTSRASASSRINQIAKHLDSKPNPFLEINTPFSTERSSRFEDERGNVKRPRPQEKKKPEQPIQKANTEPPKQANIEPPKKMSNQKPHPALLIPGPIEFDDAVLDSMSHHRYA